MIQEIYTRLSTDQEFAKTLKKFAKNKTITSAEDEVTLFIEFAQKHGYDVTLDDLKEFAEKQCQALTEKELETINAAGAGGFCILVGGGWGDGDGVGKTSCKAIGIGFGVTWEEEKPKDRLQILKEEANKLSLQ